jgi:hypothetical protein
LVLLLSLKFERQNYNSRGTKQKDLHPLSRPFTRSVHFLHKLGHGLIAEQQHHSLIERPDECDLYSVTSLFGLRYSEQRSELVGNDPPGYRLTAVSRGKAQEDQNKK